jgi:hypothetical protein
MKIYTSYFGNLAKLKKAGIIPISISLWPPKFYSGLKMPFLAPDKTYIHWPEKTYTPEYQKKLSHLDAKYVLQEIIKLSGGKDVALCCYEKPGEFCHRRLIAEWLTKETGKPIEEFNQIKETVELF